MVAWQLVAFVAVVAAGLGVLAWIYAARDAPETAATPAWLTAPARLLLYVLRLVGAGGFLFGAWFCATIAWQLLQPASSSAGIVPPRVGPVAIMATLALVFVGMALWAIRARTVWSATAHLIVSWVLFFLGLVVFLLPVRS